MHSSAYRMHVKIQQLLMPVIGRHELAALKKRGIVPAASSNNELSILSKQLPVMQSCAKFYAAPTYETFRGLNHAIKQFQVNVIKGAYCGDKATAGESSLESCLGKAAFFLDPQNESTKWLNRKYAEKHSASLSDEELLQIFAESRIKEVPDKKKLPHTSIQGSQIGEKDAEADVAGLERQIRRARLSHRAPVRLEGDTARIIQKHLLSFAEIQGMNTIIRDHAGRVVTEFDIELSHAIIECSLVDDGKLRQIERRARNVQNVNPLKKDVILYAPNYDDASFILALNNEKQNAVVKVVRNKEELEAALEQVDLRAYAEVALQSGFIRSPP